MADAPGRNGKWTNPYVNVVLADGTEFGVQAFNPDLVRYERTASKHGWPGPDKEPVTWLTFLAWSAGRREKLIPADLSWETFNTETCLQVSSPSATTVPPTPPGPDPG